MIAKPYSKDDYPTLVKWYLARGLPLPPRDLMPETGFIIDDVCAGFLYLTDSKLALIDHYISNPNELAAVRDRALDTLTEELVREAKQWGCKGILITTALDKVGDRAEKHGFNFVGDVSAYFKEL